MMDGAVNVEFKNNIVADFFQHGIWIKNSHEIIIEGNQVHHIPPDVTEPPAMFVYPIL
jgi:parallel beta-helix repeat protein